MVDPHLSVRERLIVMETKMDTVIAHLQEEKGRMDCVEEWQRNRTFLEGVAVKLLMLLGGGGVLTLILKLTGAI
jgi:hypothetical protein